MHSGTSHALYFLRYGETQLGKNTIRLSLKRNSNEAVEDRKTVSSPAYRAMSGDAPCQTALNYGPNDVYAVACATRGGVFYGF